MSTYTDENKVALQKLVTELEAIFGKVSVAVKEYSHTAHNNIDGLRALAKTFDILYGLCREKFSTISPMKKNREVAYSVKLQEDAGRSGSKITVDAMKNQASLFVAEEREVRDMVEAKMEVCLEHLRTIRLLISTFVPVKEETV